MEKASVKKGVFLGNSLNRAASAALICHNSKIVFEEVFGKDFCRDVEIISSKNNVLYIKTKSAVYSQEIKMKETEVMTLLKKKGNLLKKISFK